MSSQSKKMKMSPLPDERQERMDFICELKDSLFLRPTDVYFDPDTTCSLIDEFVKRFHCFDVCTFMWNRNKIVLRSFAQSMVDVFLDHNTDESIMNEDETEEPMRLLISNGCEIFAVDIKQPKGRPTSKVDYLTKNATLKLAEEKLPVSVGLFRRGSDAYMIGGQSLPDDIEALVSFLHPNAMNDMNHRLHNLKGTSDDTYRLSIVNNGTLSAIKRTGILDLQSPKLWPVVAEVKGKVHVFDSFPSSSSYIADPDWRFSHEVISDDNHLSLTTKSPLKFFIRSHLMLGDHIFALTCDRMRLVFDLINLEWNSEDGKYYGSYSKISICFKNVWDILYCRSEAMCVEEIMVGNESYYVVLVLMNMESPVIVEAYLLTSKGDIVGSQALRNFFKGRVKPSSYITGAMIKGGGTDGKTMCIAFTGRATIDGKIQNSEYFFFSYTFTVELLNNSDSYITHILEDDGPKHAIAIDEKLVRIDIKDRCAYKIDKNDTGLKFTVGMEACFF